MTVRAVGNHVVVKVNGIKTAELTNDHENTEGYFGLQLHGSQDMEVYFKDIYIKDFSQQLDAGRSSLTKEINDKTTGLPPFKRHLY